MTLKLRGYTPEIEEVYERAYASHLAATRSLGEETLTHTTNTGPPTIASNPYLKSVTPILFPNDAKHLPALYSTAHIYETTASIYGRPCRYDFKTTFPPDWEGKDTRPREVQSADSTRFSRTIESINNSHVPITTSRAWTSTYTSHYLPFFYENDVRPSSSESQRNRAYQPRTVRPAYPTEAYVPSTSYIRDANSFNSHKLHFKDPPLRVEKVEEKVEN